MSGDWARAVWAWGLAAAPSLNGVWGVGSVGGVCLWGRIRVVGCVGRGGGGTKGIVVVEFHWGVSPCCCWCVVCGLLGIGLHA